MSTDSSRLVRAPSSFRATHQRFVVRTGARRYEVQYSHIYKGRIAELRPVVLHAARQRWPEADGERASERAGAAGGGRRAAGGGERSRPPSRAATLPPCVCAHARSLTRTRAPLPPNARLAAHLQQDP